MNRTQQPQTHVTKQSAISDLCAMSLNLAALSPIEKLLIDWGKDNLPEAVDAIANNLDKKDYCLRCIGAIFRAGVKQDPAFLWRCVDVCPKDLNRLSKWIGNIRWGDMGYPEEWGDVPGKLGWYEWIQSADLAGCLMSTSRPQRWIDLPGRVRSG